MNAIAEKQKNIESYPSDLIPKVWQDFQTIGKLHSFTNVQKAQRILARPYLQLKTCPGLTMLAQVCSWIRGVVVGLNLAPMQPSQDNVLLFTSGWGWSL